MRAILTPDDLKKGTLVPPSWYNCEITDYEEKEAGDKAKNPGSTNCIFSFKILDGDQKGIVLTRLYNETAMGFAKALLTAVNYPKTPEGGYDLSSDQFKKMIGMKVKAYVKRGKGEKGEFNDVQDFQALTAA